MYNTGATRRTRVVHHVLCLIIEPLDFCVPVLLLFGC